MRYIRRNYGEEAWQQYLREGKKRWEGGGGRKRKNLVAIRPDEEQPKAKLYRHEFRNADESQAGDCSSRLSQVTTYFVHDA